MPIKVTGKCEAEDCDLKATHLWCEEPRAENSTVLKYCEKHQREAYSKASGEYEVTCPNCKCGFTWG